MYSWEIDNYIRSRNWILKKHEYIYISDIKVNPQISKIKYEQFSNSFYMETDDGYNWIFRLKE